MIKILEDKNPKDNHGWTPLHSAAQYGHLEICKLICRIVNEKNPKSNGGYTPIGLATIHGKSKVLTYLKEANNVS